MMFLSILSFVGDFVFAIISFKFISFHLGAYPLIIAF